MLEPFCLNQLSLTNTVIRVSAEGNVLTAINLNQERIIGMGQGADILMQELLFW